MIHSMFMVMLGFLTFWVQANSVVKKPPAPALDQWLGQRYPFVLPELPYPTEALEPIMDAQTLSIHHGKHHAGYVQKTNEILGQHAAWQALTLFELVTQGPIKENSDLRNQLGGHINHGLFWWYLKPAQRSGEAKPKGRLAKEIEKTWGSWESFQKAFEQAGLKLFGSGWVWLVRTPEGSLQIITTANQDNPLMNWPHQGVGEYPILGVDVWEHAYYLKYQNRRGEYLQKIWDLIDWSQVEAWDVQWQRWIKKFKSSHP